MRRVGLAVLMVVTAVTIAIGAALELGYTQIAGLSAYWQPSIIRNQKHGFSLVHRGAWQCCFLMGRVAWEKTQTSYARSLPLFKD